MLYVVTALLSSNSKSVFKQDRVSQSGFWNECSAFQDTPGKNVLINLFH